MVPFDYAPGLWAGWWLFPLLMMLIVLAVAVVVVRWFVAAGPGGRPAMHPDDALDVLRRRYAAGEISGEQFEEMRRVLTR
jgi:uncharacterized membrane protein